MAVRTVVTVTLIDDSWILLSKFHGADFIMLLVAIVAVVASIAALNVRAVVTIVAVRAVITVTS